jgi:hypothetical protein
LSSLLGRKLQFALNQLVQVFAMPLGAHDSGGRVRVGPEQKMSDLMGHHTSHYVGEPYA